ncbi:uncharacterized protein LOC142775365 [Rhipicephalus microplus]|uniref:uncharacterized protein LOC142775365 n=1 Tax=Rhipicephalus microplus TaxID=6941 RepID=UPI003F6A5573
MVYFVYVIYAFDKVKKVTTSNHVKNFKQKNSSDFEVKRLYSIYWDGDSRSAGAYYNAEFLHMTGPETTKNRQVAKQKVSRQILQDMTEKQASELCKELALLKEQNRKLRSFIMKLQEELLHHLSEARMRAEQTAPCSCGKVKEKSPPATRSEATWSPMHGDHTNALHSGQVPQNRPTLSQQLFTGLDPAAFPGQVLCAEAAPAETQPPQHSRPHPPLAEAEPAEPESLQNSRPQPPAVETPPAFTLMGSGMVHLANSVTVTKEVYETLMAVPKDSHFIKRAATAI